MKIISVEAINFKSIPKKCDPLNFFNKNNDKEEPESTLILGENGTSKSTFLEGLALLSHVNIMNPCLVDPTKVKNPSFLKVKVFLKNKEHTGVLVFAAKKKITDVDFSSETAGLISSHIVDEALIKEHWCVFYPDENPEGFKECYEKILIYNRPSIPEQTDKTTAGTELIPVGRVTKRAKKLFTLDKTPDNDSDAKSKITDELKENGTITLINTDMNDYGVGLNIFESPKNIKTDLSLVIHHRLPCTKVNGTLRNLDKLKKLWGQIFKNSKIEQVVCNPVVNSGAYETLFEISNRSGEKVSVATLSSGENEVFFVLATIVGLELYNSVLLLDEPELHLATEQLQSYYEVLFGLADEYNLQLIIVTHQPFVTNHVVEKRNSSYKKLRSIEMRLLKPEESGNKLSIIFSKTKIGDHIFEKTIIPYYGKAYERWSRTQAKTKKGLKNVHS